MSNNDFSIVNFFSKEGFGHWGGVFDEYTSCTDKFIKVFSEQYKDDDATDVPYWNNERPNIGMLSVACWQHGWITLEEYSTDKSTGSGRCDLWVSSEDGNYNYAIEAKKGDCSLDSEKITRKLKSLLIGKSDCSYKKTENGSALCDAQNLSEDEGDERMGIAFMHFYLRKKNRRKVIEIVKKAIEELTNYFNSSDDVDFMYIYLKSNGVVSDNDSIIPGVVIAGKVVR